MADDKKISELTPGVPSDNDEFAVARDDTNLKLPWTAIKAEFDASGSADAVQADLNQHKANQGIHYTDAPADGNQYARQNRAWVLSTGAGVSDHGDLTGLADDDHLQYHTDARGDARYDALGDAQAVQDNLDQHIGAIGTGVHGVFTQGNDGFAPGPTATDVSNAYVLGASGAWVPQTGGAGGGDILNDTPPPSPSQGQGWVNTTTMRRYVWYDDGTSQQWVQVDPSVAGGGGGGGGGGEVNQGINIGTGAQIYAGQVGTDLAIRSIIGIGGVSATQNANDVTVQAVPSAIDHQALLNAGTITHAQIDAHIAAAGPSPDHSGDIVSVGDGLTTIQPGVVNSGKIATGGVTSDNIAFAAVKNDKLDAMLANTIKLRRETIGQPEDVAITGLQDEPSPNATTVLMGQVPGGNLVKIEVGNLPTGAGGGGTVRNATDGTNTSTDKVTWRFVGTGDATATVTDGVAGEAIVTINAAGAVTSLPESPADGQTYGRRGSDTSWQPVYLKTETYSQTEADGLFDAAGAADAAVAAHEAAPDPHPQYLTQTEADGLYGDVSTVGPIPIGNLVVSAAADGTTVMDGGPVPTVGAGTSTTNQSWAIVEPVVGKTYPGNIVTKDPEETVTFESFTFRSTVVDSVYTFEFFKGTWNGAIVVLTSLQPSQSTSSNTSVQEVAVSGDKTFGNQDFLMLQVENLSGPAGDLMVTAKFRRVRA